jgi:hypothetical protein
VLQTSLESLVQQILDSCSLVSPPIDLDAVAHHLEVNIKSVELEDDISGFLVAGQGRTAARVNARHQATHQRWAKAQLLGYRALFSHAPTEHRFILDTNLALLRRTDALETGSWKAAEYSATPVERSDARQLALALLMPSKLLMAETVRHDPTSELALAELARKFDVSSVALMLRLLQLGIVQPAA